MSKHPTYAQEAFEKKLKAADDFEHKYYQLMQRYFPLPNFEQLVLNNLSKEFGKSETWDLLPYIASDYQDDPYGDDQDDAPMDQDEGMTEDSSWDEETRQAHSELIEQEEKFKQLCNLAGAYTASVTISICNICGLITQDVPQVKVLSVLNLAARAQMNANSAINALFPQMNFVNATVYARRSALNLASVTEIIDQLGDLMPAKKVAMSPLKLTVQRAYDATTKLAEESDKMGDNPNLPF